MAYIVPILSEPKQSKYIPILTGLAGRPIYHIFQYLLQQCTRATNTMRVFTLSIMSAPICSIRSDPLQNPNPAGRHQLAKLLHRQAIRSQVAHCPCYTTFLAVLSPTLPKGCSLLSTFQYIPILTDLWGIQYLPTSPIYFQYLVGFSSEEVQR